MNLHANLSDIISLHDKSSRNQIQVFEDPKANANHFTTSSSYSPMGHSLNSASTMLRNLHMLCSRSVAIWTGRQNFEASVGAIFRPYKLPAAGLRTHLLRQNMFFEGPASFEVPVPISQQQLFTQWRLSWQTNGAPAVSILIG